MHIIRLLPILLLIQCVLPLLRCFLFGILRLTLVAALLLSRHFLRISQTDKKRHLCYYSTIYSSTTVFFACAPCTFCFLLRWCREHSGFRIGGSLLDGWNSTCREGKKSSLSVVIRGVVLGIAGEICLCSQILQD